MDDKPEVIYIGNSQPFVSELLAAISPLNFKRVKDDCISEVSDALECMGAVVLVPHIRAVLKTYDKRARVIISPGERVIDPGYNTAREEVKSQTGLYISESGSNSRQFLAARKVTGYTARLMVGIAPQPVKPVSKFILSAISKDQYRPALMRHYGNMSTDGFRLHYDQSLPPSLDFYTVPLYSQMIKLLDEAQASDKARVELSPAAVRELIRACKMAKKIKASIKLSVNGNLDYTISDYPVVINGNISAGYQHTGENITILFDPAQLLDALEPINTVILFKDKDHAAYIAAGTHEAVIMPRELEEATG